MKVLKSGIEIDPRKLKKIKGGSCACHCDIGYHGTVVNVPGHVGDICLCSCSVDLLQDASGSTTQYI